ncbi:MAG: hypothetical protein H0X65_06795 [Gemmatimonadetes bacterium]|nr:hypothetical protein [Gemmatimonadota bacterium]
MTESSRRRDSIFQARLRFWTLAGILIGVAIASLLVLLLTQTRWGHEQVLGFTLRAASERLEGTLEIQRLDGNLLAGARLYGVALRGLDGEPFLLADSAFVEYSLRSVAGDELVLDNLIFYDPQIFLRQLPGDTLWNYQKIFADTTAPAEPGTRSPIVLRAASLVGARILVEMAWEPDEELSPVEQRTEIAEALTDTSRILVREVPGGYLRTMRFTDVDADLARIVSAPDELGGISLRVERFSGDVQIFRQPVRVQQAEMDLAFRDSQLEFRASEIVLPASRLTAFGAVVLGEANGPRLDITVQGDTVALRDLQWLYPRLPDEGGGSLVLLIESRPEGTLYLARDLRLSAPGTRLEGSFGVILNDAVRFVDVNLQADPLRVSTVEQMLPTELPVIGLRIGGLEIRQPAS